MKDGKTFTVALVGYGGMGAWHADTLARIPEAALAGIYDIDPARGKAAEGKGLRAYPTLEALLADPAVDIVTVATPNDTHLPLVLQALRAGKHVVCEKPVALSSGELAQMVACAEENDRLFTVHQNRRWDEDYLTIKRLYDENTLGRVFNIESRVHGSRGIPSDWRNRKKHGGGMVLDWGVHILDQVMMLLAQRRLESLYATLTNVTNEEVDDGFRVLLNFDDGLTVMLEVGTSNFIDLPRWYIQGENGTAVVRDWALAGEVVMVSDWEKRDAVPVVTAAGLTKTMAPRTDETIATFPLPKVAADIRDFYRNVAEAAAGAAPLLVRPDQVMRVMRVMEAIFASAEGNRVVAFAGDDCEMEARP